MPTKLGQEVPTPKAVAPFPTGVEYQNRVQLTDGVMTWCVSRIAWELELEHRKKPQKAITRRVKLPARDELKAPTYQLHLAEGFGA